MPEKGQYFIYSEKDLSLIKNTFADNDEFLYAIRNVLLQLPLSDRQKSLLSTQMNEHILEILKTRILPEISSKFPLGQIPSIMTTLTEDLKARFVDDMAPQFEAKELEIAYLAQQFKELETGEKGVIILADLAKLEEKTPEQKYVDTTAYLFLLGYIDPMLGMIKNLAGEKDETPEDQKKRLTRDSSK